MSNFLKLSSLIVLVAFIASCSNPYKHLQITEKRSSAFQYKPEFDRALYRCVVNGKFIFKKYHLSGLLLFKQLENGTVRAIYQNEMGITFFDFEWDANDSFQLNKIIPQLDKPAVVKVLKKDVELLLMKGIEKQKENVLTNRGNELFYCLNIKDGGRAYYVTKNDTLERIENAGSKTKVTTLTIAGKETKTSMPRHVFIAHHKANFTIQLDKIEQDVNE